VDEVIVVDGSGKTPDGRCPMCGHTVGTEPSVSNVVDAASTAASPNKTAHGPRQ
jgi:hypothetical protein